MSLRTKLVPKMLPTVQPQICYHLQTGFYDEKMTI